jgi:uncharacterized protein
MIPEPASTHQELDIPRLVPLLDSRVFELIILPTEKCNFRCTYCYEDFEIGRMTRQTIDAVKQLIRNRVDELDALQLSWFGGEPLLASKIVLEISQFAKKLADERQNLRYQAHITTNASLLDAEMFSKLTAAGVTDYQISLDGPKDIHDQSRRNSSGTGTFDRIWNNLLAIRRTDIPANLRLRIHFDSDTAFQMDSLIQQLRLDLLPDKRFQAVFHEIERLGGPNDAQIKSLSATAKSLTYDYLNRRLHGKDFVAPPMEPYVCYAARANSLLIRADGRIGKCTVALNDARNDIGKLNDDGTLTLSQPRLSPWLRGITNLDPHVLECPLVGLPELPTEHLSA